MPKKAPPAPVTHTVIDDVTDAGLELGRAVLAAEVEIIASVLGMGAALVPHPRPDLGLGAAAQAPADEAEVEEGFDNMPV